jgi:hypothetical protein
MSNQQRFESLAEYIEETGRRKNWVARELGVEPPVLSKLLKPHVWHPKVDDDLAARIAGLLKQPVKYVRSYYAKKAA